MSSAELRPVLTPLTLALIFALAAIWGSAYSFVKIALETVTPFTLTAARLVLSAFFLLAIVAIRRCHIPRESRFWRRLCVQSFINAILPFSAFAWGQQFVTAGLAGIINSASPIFVFAMTALWTRHERADGERMFGTVVGLGGVLTIIGLDALAGIGDHVIAEIVLLIGTFGYAMSAVHGRHFAGVAPEVTAAGTLGLAALVMAPLAFLIEDPLSLSPAPEALWSILYLGLAGTGLTFMIYFFLVARIGSMNTVTASYLRAGFAVIFGMILLSEPLTWRLFIGLAAVVIGVAAISGQFSRAWRRLRGRPPAKGDGERPVPIVR